MNPAGETPILPRAALVPVGDVGRLEGIRDHLEMLALPVSLGEGTPTHLFLAAPTLSPTLSASILAIPGGRLLLGRPDQWGFAERRERIPEGRKGEALLSLEGIPEPLRIGAPIRTLGEILDLRWAAPDSPRGVSSTPGLRVTLRPAGAPRRISGVLLAGPAISDFTELLDAYPESRFARTLFAPGDEEVILSSRSDPLEGIPGEAFSGVDLSGSLTLLVPAGFELDPPFASAWLAQLLGRDHDVLLWKGDALEGLRGTDFLPVSRRAWRRARGTHAGR